MTTTTPTTSQTRSHVGYLPHDMPLAAATALALPYELPRTDAQCRARFGKPGRRVVVHITVEELSE